MRKFKQLPRKWKIVSIVLVVTYVFGWVFVGYVFGKKSVEASPVGAFANKSIVPEVAGISSPINGVFYTKKNAEKWKNRLPLAVIIENHLDARPQSGLNNAEVVYEALAEGGISRFLAIFLTEDTRIGPVRSNRPYFLDWVSEYKAGYAHVGGSPEAQFKVQQYKIKDLDQFFIGFPTYERVSSKSAPHNVYTTTSRLRSAASSRGYKGPVNIDSWSFDDFELLKSKRPKKFTLNLGFLGTFGFNVRWVYNPESNSYKRINGGIKHTDLEDKQQLNAKTIIVQYVEISPDSSGHGRIKIKTVGNGKAQVFKNGKVITGTWKKKSRTDRTKFVDKNGKEISMVRGRIWIEVVPKGSPVSFE